MLGTALVVFREVLEAALIVGIVAAATRGLPGRGRWIGAGILAGIAGATLVALGADAIYGLAEGMGQEIFNAAVLGIAVLMLGWHNMWMSAHGRELAREARQIGCDIRSGTRAMSVLLVVIAVAVLREGSETVLFLYGVALSGEGSPAAMLAGGAIGLAGGVAVGWMLFASLLRIPLKWFFTATSLLVLLLAAGMAGQAARFLIQADILPSLASPAWDTSSILSNSSMAGKALQGLIGYDARPAGMQVAFFVAAALAIAAGMLWARKSSARPS